MTGISRTDRLLDQLRSRMGADATGARVVVSGLQASATARPAGSPSTSPLSMVKRLHEAGVNDERVLVSRLVEGLLVGELGENVQGASFQFVVSQVVDTLQRDAESWSLCQACVAEALA
nr:hypothetical protein [Luteibacter rhizovicinus]